MAFCGHCGKRNNDEAEHCVSCGRLTEYGVASGTSLSVPLQSSSSSGGATARGGCRFCGNAIVQRPDRMRLGVWMIGVGVLLTVRVAAEILHGIEFVDPLDVALGWIGQFLMAVGAIIAFWRRNAWRCYSCRAWQ